MMEECLNGLSVQSEKYDNLEGLVLKGIFFFLTRKVITVNFASYKLWMPLDWSCSLCHCPVVGGNWLHWSSNGFNAEAR